MKEKEQDPQLAQLAGISKKLGVLIRLSAISVVKGLKLKQQVEILSDAGFGPGQIADVTGEKGSTVRMALLRLRKQREESETKDAKQAGESVDEAPSTTGPEKPAEDEATDVKPKKKVR